MNADDDLLRQAGDPHGTPFDYVIVGSGAGGGPLAARLAMSGRRVLLIEAGTDPAFPQNPQATPPGPMTSSVAPDPAMRQVFAVPAFHAPSTEDPEMSWEFSVRHYTDTARQSTDQKYDASKDPPASAGPAAATGGIFYPRAAAVGGCTAHYAMIIIRPNDADWDEIARLTDDPSWRSENMQGYFAKIENCLYYAVYKSFTHRFLGAIFEAAQWIAKKIDPRNQLDPGGHGFKGWQKTSFIDPLVILHIVKGDKTFVAVLKDVILTALSNHHAGKTFLQALGRLQLLRYLDPNVRSPDIPGRDHISLISIGTDGRRRCGLRDHLLEVQAKYPNDLVFLNPVHATRILFEQGAQAPRAIGVEVRLGAHLYQASATPAESGLEPVFRKVYARREVIVCGGAFNTPQLLMLSGIGDKAHLESFGIKGPHDSSDGEGKEIAPIVNLPGVGKNLQDRYEVSVISEADNDFSTLDTVNFKPGDANDRVLKQWLSDGTGLYATNGGAVAMMLSSTDNAKVRRDPDLFVFGVPAAFRGYYWNYSKELLYKTKGANQESRNLWSWVILKAYTNNRHGEVRLLSADPLRTPEINFHSFDDTGPGNLDCNSDVDALCEAVTKMREFNARVSAFKNGNEVQPGKGIPPGSPALRDWVKKEAWGHHACGTCRMGSDKWRSDAAQLEDENAVVDSEFRVHGVENLRIVDTSVFSKIPGYFIVTPTFMISEKAADLLIDDSATYPRALEKEEARAIRARRTAAGIRRARSSADADALPRTAPGPLLTNDGLPPADGGMAPNAQSAQTARPPTPPYDPNKLPTDTIGLALSGGGIRSATFSLGFLQALAQKHRLRDIDMISSVSGGGYAASFLGRLFSHLHPEDGNKAARIERVLSNAASPENQWLRLHAQYILGGGRHDALWDTAIILRNLTSVHLWLGVLFFSVLGLLRAWVLDCAHLGPLSFACDIPAPAWLGSPVSPWWWLPVALFALGVLPPAIGYWLTMNGRPGRHPRAWLPFVLWIVLLGSAICGLAMPAITKLSAVAIVVLVLAWFEQEAASWHMKRAPDEDERKSGPPPNPGVADPAVGTTTVRNRLTRMLGAALFGFAVSVLWVVLDTLTPVIVQRWSVPAAWSMGGIAPMLLLLRGLAISIIKRPPKVNTVSVSPAQACSAQPGQAQACSAQPNPAQANRGAAPGIVLQVVLVVIAFALVFALVLFANVLVYMVFRFDPRVGWLGTAASLLASVVIGRIQSWLNLSSLQQAYSQKLTRTFLGAANDARVHPAGTAPPVPVDVPDGGDDIFFDDYHPERKGGPLHLIGACVNNTVDPLSGNQLRDDKGMPMCAGPLGLSVGRRFHALWADRPKDTPEHVAPVTALTVDPDPNQFHVLERTNDQPVQVERLRLGQWMAISGAAATTGLGRNTRLAQSLLLGLFNIRIGYWWNSGIASGDRPGRYPPSLWRWLKSLPANVFSLQATLLNEWRAYFEGPAARMWYLSDGGHFDDTGLYELIRRHVPFMIAIDATHDPTYTCETLALLTRQVRFDFCASIEWLDPTAARAASRTVSAGWNAFASRGQTVPSWITGMLDPESIGAYADLKRGGPLNAAFARITYVGSRKGTSWLLFIKPSLSCGLPNDIQAYAARHGEFPNETTLDQFFDDNQWEAYRMLGRCTGEKIFL